MIQTEQLPVILTADRIRAILLQLGIKEWIVSRIADKDYACPTEAWVLNQFYPAWHEFMWGRGLDKWTPDHDCDDFARSFALEAQNAHFQTRANVIGSPNSEGLAIGEFWYQSATLGSHAVNIVLTGDLEAGQLPLLVEPQTGNKIVCTPSEIGTASFVRF